MSKRESERNTEINTVQIKLSKSNPDEIDLMGVVSYIILCKSIFKYNVEVARFIKEIFNLELPKYITQSRALMIARTSREIYEYEGMGYRKIFKQIEQYLHTIEIEEIRSSKQRIKNENDKLVTWLSGL